MTMPMPTRTNWPAAEPERCKHFMERAGIGVIVFGSGIERVDGFNVIDFLHLLGAGPIINFGLDGIGRRRGTGRITGFGITNLRRLLGTHGVGSGAGVLVGSSRRRFLGLGHDDSLCGK